MAERTEQMMWLPERGLIITLPSSATEKNAQNIQQGRFSPLEQTRFNIIANDSILLKRHPNPADGQQLMDEVDLSWREHLHQTAGEMAETIINSARDMNSFSQNITDNMAIVLFGSVSKNLAKYPGHHDPSNIDLAVIGNFTEDQRTQLFNSIRETRTAKGTAIGSNIGVHIQHSEKVTNGDYSTALQYIGSAAQALYDPSSLWASIETQSLIYTFLRETEKAAQEKSRRYKKAYGFDYKNNFAVQDHWEAKAPDFKQEINSTDITKAAFLTYLEKHSQNTELSPDELLEKPWLINQKRKLNLVQKVSIRPAHIPSVRRLDLALAR